MKKSLLSLLFFCAAPFVSQAYFVTPEIEDECYFLYGITGFYLSGSGSFDWHRDIELTYDVNKETFHTKTGWNSAGALGIFMDMWRFEFEVSYLTCRMDYVNTTTAAGSTKTGVSGEVVDIPLMLNIYYDVPICGNLGLYLGAGVGVSFQDFKPDAYTAGAPISDTFNKIDNTKTRFAYQVKAGFDLDVNCWIDLFAGYRFFGTNLHDHFTRETGFGTFKAHMHKTPFYHAAEAGIRVKL